MAQEPKTNRTVITPNDQILRQVFGASRSYFIDIYQREYKWTNENVETLLKDIEVHFEQYKRIKTEPREIQVDVQDHFEPYFLNTYLTHSTSAITSIVDGQQRLTTLLLILIKLYHITKTIEQNPNNIGKTFSSQSLEKLIFESDDFGGAARFKIFNENRENTFKEIVGHLPIEHQDETQKRIKDNFEIISDYYDKYLASQDDSSQYDLAKLTYYISYLLDRISIVEIKIEKQKNVAMIFEVVNDRGLGLKPYEILKGKLIGNLPEEQKEKANTVWTCLQDQYFKAELKNSTEAKLDLDIFFRTFFRAKFANTEYDYDKFEGDYQYIMYRDPKITEYFHDFTDSDLLFQRIMKDIKYFAELYLWLRTSYDNEYLIFNKLLDQNQQYLLILSNIRVNDPERDNKITEIAKKFDQFHTMIRLLDAYESNGFQRMIFPINKEIRDCTITDAKDVFDSELLRNLIELEIVREGELNNIRDLFTYEKLRGVRNRWTNFSKYVLMRIERYLSQLLDKPSYAGGSLEELEEHFNKTTRRVYGMHLEHIYAYNNSNKALFTNEGGIFDEQEFNNIRNLLGMVLLLKDKQNESSSNETYKNKITRYKQSNFIWNELMVGHLDPVDMRKIPADWFLEQIDPDYNDAFPKAKVDSRQRSICSAIKTIWFDEADK